MVAQRDREDNRPRARLLRDAALGDKGLVVGVLSRNLLSDPPLVVGGGHRGLNEERRGEEDLHARLDTTRVPGSRIDGASSSKKREERDAMCLRGRECVGATVDDVPRRDGVTELGCCGRAPAETRACG